MNVLSSRTHGIIDYIVAATLILTPFVLGFAHLDWQTWVLIYAGIVTLVASLLTHYEVGMAWAIPMPGHLALDILVGVILIASPWLLGFASETWWPHVILGALKILIALVTHWSVGTRVGTPAQPRHQVAGSH